MIRIDPELQTSHIVVADSDEAVGKNIGAALSSAGMSRTTLIDEFCSVEVLESLNPQAVILDSMLKGSSGSLLLEEIRSSSGSIRRIPVFVVCQDGSVSSRVAMLKLGANDFLPKSAIGVEVLLRLRGFLRAQRVFNELEGHTRHIESDNGEPLLLEATAWECLRRLAGSVERTEDASGEHTFRVGTVSAQIATRLGLSRSEADLIGCAAPLHDLGKMGIPDSILLKPARLSADEKTLMQTHVWVGANFMNGSDSRLLQLAEEIALTHHERWDGSGYVLGLSAEDIPLSGRIVAVADVFDALIHDRPYKQAWPIEKAVAEIKSQSGSHFDPTVVAAFVDFIESEVAV